MEFYRTLLLAEVSPVEELESEGDGALRIPKRTNASHAAVDVALGIATSKTAKRHDDEVAPSIKVPAVFVR